MPRINNITGFSSLFIMLFAFSNCSDGSQDKLPKVPSAYKETLVKANQEAVRIENEQIDDYIRRHNLVMESTETGIRVMILKEGIGQKAETGKTVKLSYSVTLLTGDTVYTAEKDGPLIFVVGKGQVITGLEEAILLLRVGDRAKFIIPSHLAFGLIGDQKKIPYKASLVYDIEFISMY
jgi:FKBP-type peptidyl-prolyl cis-trans isomerase FkpA